VYNCTACHDLGMLAMTWACLRCHVPLWVDKPAGRCLCMSSGPVVDLPWPDSWLLLAGDHGTTAQGQAGKSAAGDTTPGDDGKKAGGKGKAKAKGKAGAAKGKKGGKGKQQVWAWRVGYAWTVMLESGSCLPSSAHPSAAGLPDCCRPGVLRSASASTSTGLVSCMLPSWQPDHARMPLPCPRWST
jgi:hypothetical protein